MRLSCSRVCCISLFQPSGPLAITNECAASEQGCKEGGIKGGDSENAHGKPQVFPVRAAVPINLAIRATLHFEARWGRFGRETSSSLCLICHLLASACMLSFGCRSFRYNGGIASLGWTFWSRHIQQTAATFSKQNSANRAEKSQTRPPHSANTEDTFSKQPGHSTNRNPTFRKQLT